MRSIRMPSRMAAVAVLVAVVVAACGEEAPPTGIEAEGLVPSDARMFGVWSEPVLLDGAVNSPFSELSPILSPDELSLYFNSNRPTDGLGLVNLWVSRRACPGCPWDEARVLPPPVNGPAVDGIATLSHDGHILLWSSNREGSEPVAEGGEPSYDIWMVTRKNPGNDFGWENPVRIQSAPGCDGEGGVNTHVDEGPGAWVTAAPGGHADLYFDRGGRAFRVTVDRHGQARGCAEELAELGTPTNTPRVRADGKEMVFWASPGRGGLGGADHWVSTRRRVTDPWSPPENLGVPVNSAFGDLTGSISHDGTTMVWASAAARGGLGGQDIWISTRRRGPD